MFQVLSAVVKLFIIACYVGMLISRPVNVHVISYKMLVVQKCWL